MFVAINYASVTLIPKTLEAKGMKELRPIACCTIFYRIISKILTKRLSNVINEVVDISQLAFLPGRVIHDNIFMAHELIRGYNRKNVSPQCAIQMDIQNAYNTVEWLPRNCILCELNFPAKFVDWVMLCVLTISYMLSFSGLLTDYLKA